MVVSHHLQLHAPMELPGLMFSTFSLSLNLKVPSVFPIDCPRRCGLLYWKWHNFLFRSWVSFVSLSVPFPLFLHSFPSGSYKHHVLSSSALLTLWHRASSKLYIPETVCLWIFRWQSLYSVLTERYYIQWDKVDR